MVLWGSKGIEGKCLDYEILLKLLEHFKEPQEHN